MKALIGVLALAFCVNAAATFDSAEMAWKVCSARVRDEAQARLDLMVRQASNPTLRGKLGSTYDIHSVGGDENIVDSTTSYQMTWIVASEGAPRNYSWGEIKIRAEANGSDCKITK